MFERFTEGARQVISVGLVEARSLGHEQVGSHHLLLGMLAQEHVAARVLTGLGVRAYAVRFEIVKQVGIGQSPPAEWEPLPFAPCAKRLSELALREALSLGHNYIGTEHLLLALCREPESVGARVLAAFDGIDCERVRGTVIRHLSRWT